MDFPQLGNAPIIEGLIALHTKPQKDVTVEAFARFGERIGSQYATVKEIREIQAKIALDPQQSAPQSPVSTRVGYRLERATPPFVVHVRPSELLVSRLRPYQCWDELFTETRSIWKPYLEVARPDIITRVATRFINRLQLPLDNLDFDDYLTAAPVIPKGLPQRFEGFLTRIVVPHAASGAHIAMSQVLDTADPQTRTLAVLIDIDVYKEVEIPVESPEVWELLNAMRHVKNQAFFDSVTPKALELFK